MFKKAIGTISLLSGALAVSALTSIPALAEARVTIPFNFSMGNEQYPAGQYLLDQSSLSKWIVTLKSDNAPKAISFALFPGNESSSSSKVTLSFDVQGDNHTLRAIQYGPLTSQGLNKSANRSEHTPVRIIEGE